MVKRDLIRNIIIAVLAIVVIFVVKRHLSFQHTV